MYRYTVILGFRPSHDPLFMKLSKKSTFYHMVTPEAKPFLTPRWSMKDQQQKFLMVTKLATFLWDTLYTVKLIYVVADCDSQRKVIDSHSASRK